MNIRFAALSAGLVFALAGCASVTSDKAIFPPAMATGGASLAGTYILPSEDDNGFSIAKVSRKDAATYAVSWFAKPKQVRGDATKPHWVQSFAMEMNAVPLGKGDYVLQVTCLAERNDKSRAWDRSPEIYYWTLAAARPRGDFWLGFVSPDKASAARLVAKYGQTADSYGGIKLSGLTPDRAKAFFRDWNGALLSAGGPSVGPILDARDESKSAINAPEHPKQCSDVPPRKS